MSSGKPVIKCLWKVEVLPVFTSFFLNTIFQHGTGMARYLPCVSGMALVGEDLCNSERRGNSFYGFLRMQIKNAPWSFQIHPSVGLSICLTACSFSSTT